MKTLLIGRNDSYFSSTSIFSIVIDLAFYSAEYKCLFFMLCPQPGRLAPKMFGCCVSSKVSTLHVMVDLMKIHCIVAMVPLLGTLCSALYSSSDDVVELTEANFKTRVLQSNDLWFVEFYAPWYVFLVIIAY